MYPFQEYYSHKKLQNDEKEIFESMILLALASIKPHDYLNQYTSLTRPDFDKTVSVSLTS